MLWVFWRRVTADETTGCWWRRLRCVSSASPPSPLLSEWIHPADWSFSFTGSRLRSGSYQSSQQLSICQLDSITAALLLWGGSVSIRSRSLGLWRRWLLLMFSCHWLAFLRAVSQRPEASDGTSPDREIDTNTVRTHLVSAPAQEMKTVHLTGWRVRMKTLQSKQTGSEINTWQITVTTNSQQTVQHSLSLCCSAQGSVLDLVHISLFVDQQFNRSPASKQKYHKYCNIYCVYLPWWYFSVTTEEAVHAPSKE